jgi:hypothetical protein
VIAGNDCTSLSMLFPSATCCPRLDSADHAPNCAAFAGSARTGGSENEDFQRLRPIPATSPFSAAEPLKQSQRWVGNPTLGNTPMIASETFRRFAAECQALGRFARSKESKGTWSRLAARWPQCAELVERHSSAVPLTPLDRRSDTEDPVPTGLAPAMRRASDACV